MTRSLQIALLLIATSTIMTVAQAQNIYRCGDSYSQSPCPGGMAIDAGDSRTKGQKAQADADTQRDRQAANALEKERLKQEAAASAGTQKTGTTKAPAAAAAPHQGSRKKHKEPAYFTARTAGDKKADKKKSEKSAAP